MGPYNAAKHGVVAISESLYKELQMMAPHVKVSVLCPGWVNTNIADSQRNWPEHLALPLADETEAQADMTALAADVLKDLISSGMPTDVLADKVLDAIRAEQFWILSHADQSDQWVDAMRRRHEQMENQENPPPGFLV
jgi:short-subunit dehydrogenase